MKQKRTIMRKEGERNKKKKKEAKKKEKKRKGPKILERLFNGIYSNPC